MNYNVFLELIKQKVQSRLGEMYEITLRRQIKNNDMQLDGLIIHKTGSIISPTIYLNTMYSLYKEGQSIDDVVDSIVNVYMNSVIDGEIDVSIFEEFSKIEDKIVYRLVNKSKNVNFLQDVPHFDFLDLAVYFVIYIENDKFGAGSVVIKQKHIESWNVSKKELLYRAYINTSKIMGYSIATLNDMIKELLHEKKTLYVSDNEIENINEIENMLTDSEEKDDIAHNMYVLTNKAKYYGASCMVQVELMEQIAEYFSKNFYIIPSSVHELIIIPDDGRDMSGVKEIVRHINKNELDESEILSDNVYMYDRLGKEVSILDE